MVKFLSSTYLSAAFGYSAARTLVRTHDADIAVDDACRVRFPYAGGGVRPLLYTERFMGALAAGVVGVYLAPLFMYTDACMLEAWWRHRLQSNTLSSTSSARSSDVHKRHAYKDMLYVVCDLHYE